MRVSSDDQCRVQSRELFKPNTRYEGELAPDGTIRLMELVQKESPKARLIRRGGRIYAESSRQLTNADTQAVMEQFP